MKNFNLKNLIISTYRLFWIICMTVLLLQTYDLKQKVEAYSEISTCQYQIKEFPTLCNIEVQYAKMDSIKNNLQIN